MNIRLGKVYPKTSLQAVEPLLRGEGIPMLAAPSLSETTRALLREKKVGYWDQGGSLYLELPLQRSSGSTRHRQLSRGKGEQSRTPSKGVRHRCSNEWAAKYPANDYEELRFHRLARSPEQQRDQLREFLGDSDWALTLEHGAATIAPFLTRLPFSVGSKERGFRWPVLFSSTWIFTTGPGAVKSKPLTFERKF